MNSRISLNTVSGNGCCFAPAAVEAAKSETKGRALRLMNLVRGTHRDLFSYAEGRDLARSFLLHHGEV